MIHRTPLRCLAVGTAVLVFSISGSAVSAQEGGMAPPEPSAEHQLLTKNAGNWKMVVKMWMQPGADPMVVEGEEVITPVCKGMAVTISTKSEDPMGGMEGFGVESWDPVRNKYVGYWVDSWGGVSTYEGEMTEDGSMKYVMKSGNPMRGMLMEHVMITEFPDEKTRRMRMWYTMDTSTDPSMEVTYTRM